VFWEGAVRVCDETNCFVMCKWSGIYLKHKFAPINHISFIVMDVWPDEFGEGLPFRFR
jgi:hypothetical protein